MSEWGRETIQLIEIDQPICTRVYGNSPCQAVLGTTGERKCFNTRATCQDPENYLAGTLTLRISMPQPELSKHYGYCIPLLREVGPTPGAVNIAAMDESAGGMGQREVVSITCDDAQHSGLLVDPYREERITGAASYLGADAYDPNERGTFWGKWIAANPYHVSYPLRVRDGTLGDALETMSVRHYVIDRIEGPSDGSVRIVAKDRFALIEQAKAVVPRASRGELASAIDEDDMSMTVIPSDILDEDYPIPSASPPHFYVAIGDEVMKVSRSGTTFTIITRGALNTTAEAHDAEDLVQLVWQIDSERPHEIAYLLLTEYSAVPASWIDKDQWDLIAEPITQLYTARIGVPTPVIDLLGELCQHARMTLWPDVSDGMIKLSALRAKASKLIVDDDSWIVGDSVSIKRRDDWRVTQVWVYYGQKSPVESLDERRNFNARLVVSDVEAEALYGSPQIRTIYSRWIPQFGREQALDIGEGIIAMFRDPPREVRFAAPGSRLGELVLSDVITVRTADAQDVTGALEDFQASIVEIAGDEAGIEFKCIETLFFENEAQQQTDKTIYIENDVFDIDLRDIFDSLYVIPPVTSPPVTVTFIVLADVTVGSTSTASYAMRTGAWPAHINLVLVNEGRIQGKGGDGGSVYGLTPTNGLPGGTAFKADAEISIDNTNGELWGGGGGGGGGGASTKLGVPIPGGGGGGGGAGTQSGNGGSSPVPGAYGSPGTAESGGEGGGNGGDGGGPGLVGADGADGPGGPGADGGAAGKYAEGNSLITWIANGDRRGGVS